MHVLEECLTRCVTVKTLHLIGLSLLICTLGGENEIISKVLPDAKILRISETWLNVHQGWKPVSHSPPFPLVSAAGFWTQR